MNVYPNDPNGTADLNRKLDQFLNENAAQISVMRRLEKEFDFGFVLIAFSGEVDATRVRPYTSRIIADWNNFKVFKDQDGQMWLRPRRMYVTEMRAQLEAVMVFPRGQK